MFLLLTELPRKFYVLFNMVKTKGQACFWCVLPRQSEIFDGLFIKIKFIFSINWLNDWTYLSLTLICNSCVNRYLRQFDRIAIQISIAHIIIYLLIILTIEHVYIACKTLSYRFTRNYILQQFLFIFKRINSIVIKVDTSIFCWMIFVKIDTFIHIESSGLFSKTANLRECWSHIDTLVEISLFQFLFIIIHTWALIQC